MASKPVRFVKNANVIAIANLMALLLQGTRDMHELAEESGLNINTVQRYCAALYRAKVVYIGAWRKDGRGAHTVRVYQLGEGIDARAPVVDRAEKARRDRMKRRALRTQFERTGIFDPLLAAQTRA